MTTILDLLLDEVLSDKPDDQCCRETVTIRKRVMESATLVNEICKKEFSASFADTYKFVIEARSAQQAHQDLIDSAPR